MSDTRVPGLSEWYFFFSGTRQFIGRLRGSIAGGSGTFRDVREVFAQWGQQGVLTSEGAPDVDPETGRQRTRLTNQISIMPLVPLEDGAQATAVQGPFIELGYAQGHPDYDRNPMPERVEFALRECEALERKLAGTPLRIITAGRS